MPKPRTARPGRRRQPDASRLERIRAEAELSTPEPARSLAAAAAAKAVAPAVPSRWPFYATATVALAASLVGVYLGSALAPWSPWWQPLLAATVAFGAMEGARRLRSRVSRRHQQLALLVPIVLVGLFALGASTQVVIDGTPHLATSETAQAYRLVVEVEADLRTLASFDELIGADQTTARANIALYEPAALEMARIQAKYAQMNPADLPNEAFAGVVRSVAAGADFGARAMMGRRDLALQYDARLETDVTSYRTTFAEQVLSAGQQLSGVASLYGIPLGPDGPVE